MFDTLLFFKNFLESALKRLQITFVFGILYTTKARGQPEGVENES